MSKSISFTENEHPPGYGLESRVASCSVNVRFESLPATPAAHARVSRSFPDAKYAVNDVCALTLMCHPIAANGIPVVPAGARSRSVPSARSGVYPTTSVSDAPSGPAKSATPVSAPGTCFGSMTCSVLANGVGTSVASGQAHTGEHKRATESQQVAPQLTAWQGSWSSLAASWPPSPGGVLEPEHPAHVDEATGAHTSAHVRHRRRTSFDPLVMAATATSCSSHAALRRPCPRSAAGGRACDPLSRGPVLQFA